jgi:hypothetical protein
LAPWWRTGWVEPRGVRLLQRHDLTEQLESDREPVELAAHPVDLDRQRLDLGAEVGLEFALVKAHAARAWASRFLWIAEHLPLGLRWRRLLGRLDRMLGPGVRVDHDIAVLDARRALDQNERPIGAGNAGQIVPGCQIGCEGCSPPSPPGKP